MRNLILLLLISIVISCNQLSALETIDNIYRDIKIEYSDEKFIVGIGEVNPSGNESKDNIRAETLARNEIAKQIRIHIKGNTTDIMCEKYGPQIFKNSNDCVNEIVSIIETTVDEVLIGSKIVGRGLGKNGKYFAVAVLPRVKSASGIQEEMEDSLQKSKEALDKAKAGSEREDNLKKAKQEYLKALILDKERAFVEKNKDVEEKSGKVFEELFSELTKVIKPDKDSSVNTKNEGTEVSIPNNDRIKEIIAEGKSKLGDDTTPAIARILALNNARRRALEEAVGINVHGITVIYNEDLVADLIRTATKGVIVREENPYIQDELRLENGQPYYYVKLKAFVKPLTGIRRGDFKILNASLKRAGTLSNPQQPVFNHDDETQVIIKTNEDAFIHIFCIYEDGKLIKMLPYQHIENNFVSANHDFIFPSDTHRSSGINYKVKLLKNSIRALESVLIIATREKHQFLSNKNSEEIALTDLMQEIAELDISSWTEKIIGYEIIK